MNIRPGLHCCLTLQGHWLETVDSYFSTQVYPEQHPFYHDMEIKHQTTRWDASFVLDSFMITKIISPFYGQHVKLSVWNLWKLIVFQLEKFLSGVGGGGGTEEGYECLCSRHNWGGGQKWKQRGDPLPGYKKICRFANRHSQCFSVEHLILITSILHIITNKLSFSHYLTQTN